MKILVPCAITAAVLQCVQVLCLAVELDAPSTNQFLQVAKPPLTGIKCLALAMDGQKLLALTEHNLFEFSPATLSRKKTLSIQSKSEHALSFYWFAHNMALSPDGSHVLVLDKYISLATGNIEVTLDVASAVERGNPNPTVLDISPGGQTGLVLVYGFSGGEYNALALFDLHTGKLVSTRKTGETVHNAVFASQDQLVVFYTDGRLTIEDLKGRLISTVSKDCPLPKPGTHSVAFTGSGTNRAITVSGYPTKRSGEVCAFDLTTHKLLFQDSCEADVITVPGSEWVLYQTTRPLKNPYAAGQYPLADSVLVARNVQSGQVKEMIVRETLGLMALRPKLDMLYCADYRTVRTLALPRAFLPTALRQESLHRIPSDPGKRPL